MDKITAGVLGVSGPALFLVVVWAASSSLYDTASVPVSVPAPAPEEAVEDEVAAPGEDVASDDVAASDAPANDTAATDTTEEPTAEAAGEGAAEGEEPVAQTTEETAPEEAADEVAEMPAADAAPSGEVDLAALAAVGDARAGSRLWRQCSACHVADQEQNRVGPHLVDVLGRARASVEGFRYSDALAGLDGVWTAQEMHAWLESPRDYAPGTSMSYRGLSDAADRDNLLAYLADLQLQ